MNNNEIKSNRVLEQIGFLKLVLQNNHRNYSHLNLRDDDMLAHSISDVSSPAINSSGLSLSLPVFFHLSFISSPAPGGLWLTLFMKPAFINLY